MKRWQSTLACAVTAAALVVGGGGVAFADNLVAVDSLEAAVNSISLGSIACDTSANASIDLAIKRNGGINGTNTFKDSSIVKLSVGTITGSGLGATIAAPAQLTLPTGWGQIGNNELSDTVTSTITAGSSVAGLHTGSITYSATGVNTDGDTITRSDTVGVSWTTPACDVPDTTAPIVVLTCPTDDVLLGSVAEATWAATDEEGGSGLAGASSGTIALDTSQYGEAVAVAEAGTAVDKAGNASVEVACDYFVTEHTPPVVEPICPASPLLLGATAEAMWTAFDPTPGSGIADESPSRGTIALDTSSVGHKTATVPAGTVWDKAGNTSLAAECDYSVVYDFAGFFRPVDMGGIVNSVKAGSAVPIKFSLHGDQGLDIVATGSPTLTFTPCVAGASVDAVEETVTAGGSTLTYDAVADQYVYVWKTLKTWSGKCGTFGLTLDDGTTHTARFIFSK